jgi:N-acetylglucosamine-6-phosphate deacetylase
MFKQDSMLVASLRDSAYLAGMVVIINGRVVCPGKVLSRHCIVTDGGRIRQIAPTDQVLWPEDATVVDAHGHYVSPGFVDMHVHGGMGRDSMEGTVEALAQVARFHATGGTTALTVTTMTDSGDRIASALDAVATAMGHDFGGAQILGAHLEGPYISPLKRGAQPAAFVREPNPVEYAGWLDRAGVVTQMTLAPELPGALELIDALLEREVLPSGGHTAARCDVVSAAVERGLCHATHLFNAMSAAEKVGAYREPGAVEAFLADDRVMVELIADGKHVHPQLLKLAVKAKGTGTICLITDATAGAGLPEGTEYRLGEMSAVVRGGVGMTPDGATLAGSVSTMIECVRTMVHEAGVSVPDAVKMASANPARALGLSGRKGSLEAGKDADVTIFSENFDVQMTMVGGKIEFQR